MKKEEKKKNEILVLMLGFGLIFLVIIFTLLREKIFSKENSANSSDNGKSLIETSVQEYKTISANDLNKKIINPSTKESLTLLDIRPFDFYIEEHIMDSINISIDEFPVSSKINTKNTIVVIGKNNDDSDIKTAVAKLKEEKIEKILVLAGGMDSWKQLIGIFVTYGNPESFVDQSKVSYIDPESLRDALKQNVTVYILDVREKNEFEKSHINGAINIPFEELEKRRFEIKEKRIVVVGMSELQEFQAAVQIYDMLLASPFVMKGAMPTWEEKEFELIK